MKSKFILLIVNWTIPQGSYRFLDPKFKTFSKTVISFSRQGGQQRPLKMQKQSFARDALYAYGPDWIRFDQNEKLWKKPQDFLPFSQTLSSFSRLFPCLKNYWANYTTFSRIQASVWTLIITKGHLIKKIIIIWLIKILFVISTIVSPKITLSCNSIYIIISSNFFYVN